MMMGDENRGAHTVPSAPQDCAHTTSRASASDSARAYAVSRLSRPEASLGMHIVNQLAEHVLVGAIGQIALGAIDSNTRPPPQTTCAHMAIWPHFGPTKMRPQTYDQHPRDGHTPLLAGPAEHSYVAGAAPPDDARKSHMALPTHDERPSSHRPTLGSL